MPTIREYNGLQPGPKAPDESAMKSSNKSSPVGPSQGLIFASSTSRAPFSPDSTSLTEEILLFLLDEASSTDLD